MAVVLYRLGDYEDSKGTQLYVLFIFVEFIDRLAKRNLKQPSIQLDVLFLKAMWHRKLQDFEVGMIWFKFILS